MKPNRTVALSGGILMVSAALMASTFSPGAANASERSRGHRGTPTHAKLVALNNSGVSGHARVKVNHRRLTVSVNARGLARGLPHAQHIHFGAQARHECPTSADNTNGDFRLSTTEGAPAYGPIVVSLTTRGDTSPDSALAVTRFPTAPRGAEHYRRTTHTSRAVARAIKRGEAVVVIHGVDYNDNGKYDGTAKSELDSSLPAEATDPAVCGVLHR